MHLACVNMHMSMEEALIASTINAAASIGKAATHGSLEVGKVADLLIINAPRYVWVKNTFHQSGGGRGEGSDSINCQCCSIYR